MENYFLDLVGKTIVSIEGLEEDCDYAEIICDDGSKYTWASSDGYPNDCSVFISTVNGDINDLLNTPILKAEERTNIDENLEPEFTWSFFQFATKNGYIDVVWQGSSNGFYSESPSFEKINY